MFLRELCVLAWAKFEIPQHRVHVEKEQGRHLFKMFGTSFGAWGFER